MSFAIPRGYSALIDDIVNTLPDNDRQEAIDEMSSAWPKEISILCLQKCNEIINQTYTVPNLTEFEKLIYGFHFYNIAVKHRDYIYMQLKSLVTASDSCTFTSNTVADYLSRYSPKFVMEHKNKLIVKNGYVSNLVDPTQEWIDFLAEHHIFCMNSIECFNNEKLDIGKLNTMPLFIRGNFLTDDLASDYRSIGIKLECEITNFKPFVSKNLEELSLRYPLKHVCTDEMLAEAVNLKKLELCNNPFVKSLVNFPHLTYLNASGKNCAIDNTSLKIPTKITSLSLGNNQNVTSIEKVGPHLETLYIHYDSVLPNEQLNYCTNLSELWINGNKIIKDISMLPHLTYLNLCDNNIIDESVAECCPNIRSLDLTRNNKITDLTPFKQLRVLKMMIRSSVRTLVPFITNLDISYNESDYDLTPCRLHLEVLNISYCRNGIKQTRLSGLMALRVLHCVDNGTIKNVNALRDTLVELHCEKSQIDNDGISHLINLKILTHSGNITNHSKLERLNGYFDGF